MQQSVLGQAIEKSPPSLPANGAHRALSSAPTGHYKHPQLFCFRRASKSLPQSLQAFTPHRTQKSPLPCRMQGFLVLLNGASNRRESVIGVRADKTNGANNQHQDHSEHHRIFGDVLPAVVCEDVGEDIHFVLQLLSTAMFRTFTWNCQCYRNPSVEESGIKM
jgi:hypothetical protein